MDEIDAQFMYLAFKKIKNNLKDDEKNTNAESNDEIEIYIDFSLD